MVTRCGVLGRPIAHSLSPVLHTAAYRALGLDWAYAAYDVDEAALPGWLADLGPEWCGLSLTMPLKQAVIPLLDEVSEVALAAQAVNTVLLEPDGRRVGDNTDVSGIVAALREKTAADLGSAAVLGGGATGRAAVLALAELGCREVRLLVRDPARAEGAAEAARAGGLVVHVEALETAGSGPVDLVVSTIPAAAQTPVAAALARTAAVVLDVVYAPWPTPLGAAAEATGRIVVSGLDVLLHQAVRQVELMTGRSPAPLAAMRAALAAHGVPYRGAADDDDG